MGYHEDDSVTIYCLFARFYSLWCLDRSAILQKDIRQFGSGNTGTTNTFRVLGKSAGVIVLLMDILKGTLATCLPAIFSVTTINPLWFGVCAILGHTFPIFAKFKGGKAVATSAGMLLGYNPIFFHLFSAYFL